MKQLKEKIKAYWAMLETHLPERQIYFRTNGVVQFKRVSTTLQLAGFSAVGMFALWVVVVSINYLTRDIVLEAREKQIDEISEEYARALGDIEILQQRLLTRVDTLESRQEYLQNVMTGDPLQNSSSESSDAKSADPADTAKDMGLSPIDRISSLSFTPDILKHDRPQLYPMINLIRKAELRLQRITDSQEVIALDLIKVAKTRLRDIDTRLVDMGLKSTDLYANWNGSSQQYGIGGPYMPATNNAMLEKSMFGNPSPDAILEDPFIGTYKDLSKVWGKMQKAHDSILSIPSLEPAQNFYISSRFGRRIDPFKKNAAVHYGLDMAGWPGTKIFATAPGTVTKAGPNGAYGRMVEIDHGNGFKTRYGHMKRVRVNVGQVVSRGINIGDMGCSGRCTSTHLHYEVWFAGKPRNPLPYVRNAHNLMELDNAFSAINNSASLEDK